jgi:hypothetical protein
MMTIWIIFALMTAVVVTIVGSLLNIAREQSRLEEDGETGDPNRIGLVQRERPRAGGRQ